jgi:hypothetical protein
VKIPATTGRENQPSPPCRPEARGLAAIVKPNKVKSISQRGDAYWICENEISYSGATLV